MNAHSIKVEITGDLAPLRKQLATMFGHPVRVVEPMPLDGWLAPRKSPLVFVERSRGFFHLWVGPFGLHLGRPLRTTRLGFCADWWR